ncbi:DNA mismatch repair endonuclease MutL [Herbinix luporum]|uniref:DNA mismatch repair protein MutL n=1 Tax=Herbinix luporum TaxID=1679721 RepID=A0A0K8J5Q6_9FIRM|nr:DNA mismatch repair endonuclease MutL [Herbinix luporum]CUH92684.1 DNA mismatch repair protein MutL [Herbinix luporum]HHT56678.1 DNA mismatch repair endonuclease MutL [Herbinix luporum]
MSIIHLLDENTINHIAAGEVVERPKAVVKELIENAIDAGASAITVEIKEGGISFIRITDNGSGIAKEDIPLAFMRHATSKIKTAEDLFLVNSLGFRGEALSSIAAVSQVELITKQAASLNGYRYIIEGGEEKSLEEIGCPSGTTIIVRNLFYNTPARRKFLKSATTEAGYVNDLMERLILSHPGISFRFIVNNQVRLQSSGNNNVKDILYHIYGRDISKELLPVEFNSPDITIKGYIGKPTISRGNRNFENYFINGRYIKNHIITKAIEEAYKPFMMQHKYPFTSLYYEINPSLLDVNVHPQKMELKINNGEQVYQITYNLIKDSLSKKELIPKISLSKNDQKKVTQEKLPEPFEKNRISNLKALETLAAYQPMDNRQSANYSGDHISTNTTDIGSNISGNNKEDNQPIWDQINNSDIIKENHSYEATVNTANNIEVKDQLGLFSDFLSKEAVKDHRILGQIFSTYWLVEYQKELYIIDQHAAHEKVLYERILKAAKNNKHTSQMLLPPIVLTLSLKEQEAIKTHNKILEQLGYEIEHFGGNEFSIRAVPADLYNLSDKDLFLEFIDELTQELGFGQGDPLSILEKIASMACKSAVKANHILSTEEASSLIKELLTLENPYHCPHGRPVIISISRYELEKKFKRII